MKFKSLSIIVPLYNEETRISKTLPKIEREINKISNKNNLKVELVLVSDGSSDNTVSVVKKTSKHPNLIFHIEKENKGKGHALKKGFEKASGDYILFMDADLSTPLKHLEQFLKEVVDNKTIIIGSRKTKGANIKKHQPWLREKLGQGFTLLSNIFLVWGVTDFTCGFKMFPKRAGKLIFSKLTINRWGFDSEILFIAKKHNYKIKEIPVEWKNDNRTKVNLLKDVPNSFKEILQIRINDLAGKYKKVNIKN